jgi:hypothetical protein
MVNVNTVYQTVLQILNKEQRGYITPAEFNNLAQQVQLEIFESYFPDGNQLNRQNQNNTQNNTDFFNIFKNQEEKISPFIKNLALTYDTTEQGWSYNPSQINEGSGELEFEVYWHGEILSSYSSSNTSSSSYGSSASTIGGSYITQLVSKSDYNKLTRCKLTAPTEKYPLAYTDTGNFRPSFTPYFKIFPLPTSVEVNCVVTPNPPAWNFRTASQGQYVYSPSASRDFSLSKVEQTNIIINILKYAGVIINDPTIIDVAAQESAKVQANEKS